MPDAALATVVADGTCEYFDVSGEVGQTYWYWVEATITKVIPEPLTLVGVLDEAKHADVTPGGDAEWLLIEDACGSTA